MTHLHCGGTSPCPSTGLHAFVSVLLPQCNEFAVVASLRGVIDYFFIHSFIKCLLNTCCELGVGFSPGNTGRIRQVLSPEAWTLWSTVVRDQPRQGGSAWNGLPQGGDSLRWRRADPTGWFGGSWAGWRLGATAWGWGDGEQGGGRGRPWPSSGFSDDCTPSAHIVLTPAPRALRASRSMSARSGRLQGRGRWTVSDVGQVS